MADLLVVVHAETSWKVLEPSGIVTGDTFLVVRVTNAGGQPVTGLKKSHFTVWGMTTPPTFDKMDVDFFSDPAVDAPAVGLPNGIYIVRPKWGPPRVGSYVYVVKVQAGAVRKGGTTPEGIALVTAIQETNEVIQS